MSPKNTDSNAEPSVRERVLRHVRNVVSAGAVAATLAADKPREPAGYMVVDMMPTPANRACEPGDAPSMTLRATAHWTGFTKTAVSVEIDAFTKDGDHIDRALVFTAPTELSGANLMDFDDAGKVKMAPVAGAKTFEFTTKATCLGHLVGTSRGSQDGLWRIVVTLPAGKGTEELRTEVKPEHKSRR